MSGGGKTAHMTGLRRSRHDLLKRVLDSRWFWDLVIGPVYNRLICEAASEVYRLFIAGLRPPSGARILDVGCGPGHVALMLAQEHPSASVTGVDYSATQVKAAARLKTRRRVHNCDFLRANAMCLPFDDASFDLVVSFASIKHWPDTCRGLKEIRRVLAPDGAAFVAEADREAPADEVCRFADRFRAWYVWYGLLKWYARRIVFGQSLSRDEAGSAARSAGFGRVFVEKMAEWPFFVMELRP